MTAFTLTCITPEIVARRPRSHIEDFVEYQSPDAVCLVGTARRPRAQVRLQQVTPDDVPVFYPALEPNVQAVEYASFDICLIGDDATDTDFEGLDDRLRSDAKLLFISNQLDLTIDTEALQTTLDVVGDISWPPTAADDDTLALSGCIDGDYEQSWNGLSVHGLAPIEHGEGGGSQLPYLTVADDGTVSTTFLSSDRLGLRAVPGVGQTREERLKKHGYETRRDLADASTRELQELRGIGEKTAKKYVSHAEALANETVVRTSDAQLPVNDPIFIDIETDGLNPNVIWQIGAYDPMTDEYEVFLQKDPSEPGGAVEAFCEWLAGQNNNAIAAWNGWGFDFPHLERFVQTYAPDHESTLGRTFFFDPLSWCVEKEHAALPGRSNKLDVVAAALGYDRADTGLDGERVGKLYRRWMMSQSEDAELDWERHIQYCKDDVYGLVHVFRAIEDAGRVESTPRGSSPTGQETRQGNLSDF